MASPSLFRDLCPHPDFHRAGLLVKIKYGACSLASYSPSAWSKSVTSTAPLAEDTQTNSTLLSYNLRPTCIANDGVTGAEPRGIVLVTSKYSVALKSPAGFHFRLMIPQCKYTRLDDLLRIL